MNRMPIPSPKPILTREERRAKREARRAKQREENVRRTAKMHASRIAWEPDASQKGKRASHVIDTASECGLLGLVLLAVAGRVLPC